MAATPSAPDAEICTVARASAPPLPRSMLILAPGPPAFSSAEMPLPALPTSPGTIHASTATSPQRDAYDAASAVSAARADATAAGVAADHSAT